MWKPTFRYCVTDSLPLGPALRWLHPIHTPTHYLCGIHFNIIILHTPSSIMWSVAFRCFCYSSVCVYYFSRECYIPRPYHISFEHQKILDEEYV
jgi:hypothetical protein